MQKCLSCQNLFPSVRRWSRCSVEDSFLFLLPLNGPCSKHTHTHTHWHSSSPAAINFWTISEQISSAIASNFAPRMRLRALLHSLLHSLRPAALTARARMVLTALQLRTARLIENILLTYKLRSVCAMQRSLSRDVPLMLIFKLVCSLQGKECFNWRKCTTNVCTQRESGLFHV